MNTLSLFIKSQCKNAIVSVMKYNNFKLNEIGIKYKDEENENIMYADN